MPTLAVPVQHMRALSAFEASWSTFCTAAVLFAHTMGFSISEYRVLQAERVLKLCTPLHFRVLHCHYMHFPLVQQRIARLETYLNVMLVKLDLVEHHLEHEMVRLI